MLKKFQNSEDKKKYLLKKFQQTDVDINQYKQFGVFFKSEEEMQEEPEKAWQLVAMCSTKEEAEAEIKWRLEFTLTNNTQIVLEKDNRFKTFEDETKNTDENGNYIKPTQNQLVGYGYDPEKPFMENLPSVRKPNLPQKKFKTLAHYGSIELNYKGYYKIHEVYHF